MSERVDTTALRDGTYWLARESIRKALEEAATADGFRHDWYSEDVAPLVATIRKSADELDALRAVIANAPHEPNCDTHVIRYDLRRGTGSCTCWKSRVEGTTR